MASRSIHRLARPATSPSLLRSTCRPFTSSPGLLATEGADKKWQERDQIRPTANEYSKSASDADSAAIEDTAFSKDKTRPEEQMDAAKRESGSDESPLAISGANKDMSKSKDPAASGAESSSSQSGKGASDRQRSSGKGETNKAGEGQRYQS